MVQEKIPVLTARLKTAMVISFRNNPGVVRSSSGAVNFPDVIMPPGTNRSPTRVRNAMPLFWWKNRPRKGVRTTPASPKNVIFRQIVCRLWIPFHSHEFQILPHYQRSGGSFSGSTGYLLGAFIANITSGKNARDTGFQHVRLSGFITIRHLSVVY